MKNKKRKKKKREPQPSYSKRDIEVVQREQQYYAEGRIR